MPTVETVTRDDTVDVTRPGGELSSLVPPGARWLAGRCFPEVLRAPQAERGAWLFSMPLVSFLCQVSDLGGQGGEGPCRGGFSLLVPLLVTGLVEIGDMARDGAGASGWGWPWKP